MGRTAFTQENRVKTGIDLRGVPRVRLEKGESARVHIRENPMTFYVHRLEAPLFLNGAPKMETKTRKDRSTYEVHAKEFLSAPRCFGDEGVLADKGSDPDGCVMCRVAKSGPTVGAPTRRHAINVVRYQTRPGSMAPSVPFQVEILAWTFTDRKFDKLVEIVESWGALDRLDLQFGPCENKDFQNFEISVLPECLAIKDPQQGKIVELAFQENKNGDEVLGALAGADKELKWVEADLETIAERWEQVNRWKRENEGDGGDVTLGMGSGAMSGAMSGGTRSSGTTLAEDLSGLLDASAGGVRATSEPQAGDGSHVAVSNDSGDPWATLPPKGQGSEASGTKADPLNFTDLLNS